MSEPVEQFARDFAKRWAVVIEESRRALQRMSMVMLAAEIRQGALSEGADAIRYRMMLNSERMKAKRFLETLIREERASLRARGLDIPSR